MLSGVYALDVATRGSEWAEELARWRFAEECESYFGVVSDVKRFKGVILCLSARRLAVYLSQQLALMDETYQRAINTICWIVAYLVSKAREESCR